MHYLDVLAGGPTSVFKPHFPDHLTAGVIVLSADGEQVLLNLHGKAKRWFAFGGHLEQSDASLLAAATREATEESGIPDLRVYPDPVHLSQHTVDFCSPRGIVTHCDVRYVATPAGTSVPVISDESLDVRWFRFDDAPIDEDDMVDLIALARLRILG